MWRHRLLQHMYDVGKFKKLTDRYIQEMYLALIILYKTKKYPAPLVGISQRKVL